MPIVGDRAAPPPEPVRAAVDYRAVLGRYRWWILTAVAVGTLVAVGYVITVPRRYESAATLRFRTSAELGGAAGVVAVERTLPRQVAAAGIGRVKTQDALQDAARRLGDISPPALSKAITARLDTATNQVDVVGQASKPRRAAQLAGAMADAAVAQEARRVRANFRVPVRTAVLRLRAAPGGARGRAVRLAVSEDLATLRSFALFARPVDVVRRATIPRSPVRPRPTFDVLLGTVAGLGCGLLGAFCAGVTTARTRRRPAGRTGDLDAPTWATARIAMAVDTASRPTVVGVFGSWRGAGRTTVALDLADELAARGRRVALVEADLRAPALSRRLGLGTGPGLGEVLAGTASAGDALRPLPRDRGGEVDCLPAGGTTARPDALLAGPEVGELLAELTASYDTVVIDTAAAELAPDALELLALVGVRVVCTADGRPPTSGVLGGALATRTDGVTLAAQVPRQRQVKPARVPWPARRRGASRAV